MERTSQHCRGFTLIELVMTIVILSILAVVALPKLFDRGLFETHGYTRQVQSVLRYAQKLAIARHGYVCVAFTSTSVTLSSGASNACGTAMPLPDGSSALTAPGSASFSALPTDFYFDPAGRPSVGTQTLSINGTADTVTVEAESGYVHL